MKIFNDKSQVSYGENKPKTNDSSKKAFKAFNLENKSEDSKDKSEGCDIRCATYEEFSNICNKLYRNNKISLYERGMLTFNPMKSPQFSKITKGKSNDEYYLTGVNGSGRRDWVLEFEKRIENQRSLGNILGANHMEKTLHKIKKLESI